MNIVTTVALILKKFMLTERVKTRRAIKKIIELSTNAESLWNSRSAVEKVEFLKKVISNPVLDGPRIRYDLQKPFAVIVQMSGNLNWRPQGDSNPCILREREVS